MSKARVSVIVPAYNEEKTVADVISVLQKSTLIDEVICINDGSSDNTREILKQFEKNIVIIDLKKNQGKGNALAQGIKKAKGDIVVFLDADLISLSDKHIQLLIEPLLKHTHKATMGYMVGKLNFSFFTEITGQRAYFRKDLLPHLEEISKTRFGVEIFLNKLFSQKETKKVVLPDLTSLFKYEKQTPETALKEYIREGVEIAKAIGNMEILPDSDFKILSEILNITNMKEIQIKINNITNTKTREILNKYFLKYLRTSRRNNN